MEASAFSESRETVTCIMHGIGLCGKTIHAHGDTTCLTSFNFEHLNVHRPRIFRYYYHLKTEKNKQKKQKKKTPLFVQHMMTKYAGL